MPAVGMRIQNGSTWARLLGNALVQRISILKQQRRSLRHGSRLRGSLHKRGSIHSCLGLSREQVESDPRLSGLCLSGKEGCNGLLNLSGEESSNCRGLDLISAATNNLTRHQSRAFLLLGPKVRSRSGLGTNRSYL